MKYFLCGLTICCIGLAGCSGGIKKVKLVPVKGKLYIDEEVKGDVVIQFMPLLGGTANPAANAVVNADGTFELTTYEPGDGAKPGDYSVVVSAKSSGGGSTDPAVMMGAMGGGIVVKENTVKIPAAGSENFELKLETEKPKKAPGSTLLGS